MIQIVAKVHNLSELYFANREDWHSWLVENHSESKGVWLVYNKAHSGIPRVQYDDAVEEALCFGWIDSIVRKLDDERYCQKFTPRRPTSLWSKINKERVGRLLKANLIAEAGLRSIRVAKQNGTWLKVPDAEKSFSMPTEFALALEENPLALKFYDGLAPSYQKEYIQWIGSAKREDTRNRRSSEAIRKLRIGSRLGLK